MPGRKTPLVTGEIYHIFNRGINRIPTFIKKKEYERAVDCLQFYRFKNPPVRLSVFLRYEDKKQNDVLKILKDRVVLIDILSFCLMPNHFHFLLRQKAENGISKFLSNFQNSYTRYFNTKNERDGSLFLNQFKAVRIETDEQLLHVSRYIHLNPHTGYVIKNLQELMTYPWSSFSDYMESSDSFVEIDLIMKYFKNNSVEYQKFVFDQADYQKKLKDIEHLLVDNS